MATVQCSLARAFDDINGIVAINIIKSISKPIENQQIMIGHDLRMTRPVIME